MIIHSKNLSYALRHKVLLEKKIHTTDGAGGFTAAWELVASVWAEIRRLKAGESYSHGKIAAAATYVFRLRYRSDIREDMRFCYDGRVFNIRTINNVEEGGRMLEVYAEEGVAV